MYTETGNTEKINLVRFLSLCAATKFSEKCAKMQKNKLCILYREVGIEMENDYRNNHVRKHRYTNTNAMKDQDYLQSVNYKKREGMHKFTSRLLDIDTRLKWKGKSKKWTYVGGRRWKSMVTPCLVIRFI